MAFKKNFSFLKPDTTKALQFFQLFRFGSLFLVGILFSKAGLPLKTIGTYEILMLLASLVSFFWLSGFINGLLSLYKEPTSAFEKSKELFTAYLLICLLSLIGFIVLRTFSHSILNTIGYPGELAFFKLFSWYALINVPTFLIEYIFLLKNKPQAIIVYAIISFTVQILLTVAPAFLYKSIELSLYGLLVLAICKQFLLSYLLVKYASFQINYSLIKIFMITASPLVLSTLLSGSAEYIDGVMVAHYFGTGNFAIYQYGARELPVALLLANALSSSMIPWFSKEALPLTLTRIKQQSRQLMHLLFPISIVLLLVSKKVYPIIFNPAFVASSGIFNIFLLLIISRLVFPQTILIGLKKNKGILWTSLLELILNVGLSLYFLHHFGMIGIALGTLVAYVLEKAILVYYTWKTLKIRPGEYISIQLLCFYSILLTSVYLLNIYFQS